MLAIASAAGMAPPRVLAQSATVTITSPADWSTVRGTITIAASASADDPVVGLRFFVDGQNIGVEDTTAPFEAAWDTTAVADGVYMLFAEARDTAGNFWNAGAVGVTVANDAPPGDDVTRPTVNITFPTFSDPVAGTITASAEASDDAGVVGIQFFVDDRAIDTEGASSPYSILWDTTTVEDGSHTLAVVARDEAGNRGSATVSVTVSNGDITPPAVTITSPESQTAVSGVVTVVASASDNVEVAGVQIFLDRVPLDLEKATAPYEVSWDTTSATDGTHTLSAVARDAAGNTATSEAVTITVSNDGSDITVPTVAITSPKSGDTITQPVAIRADASDDAGVAGVRFFVDGAEIGAEDTAAPYETSMWDASFVDGSSHTLTAVARDVAGNTATSASVTVTVSDSRTDNTRPKVIITSPKSGDTVTGSVTVSAQASDNTGVTRVQFSLDNTWPAFAEDTAAPYEIMWDTTTAADGSHTLSAVAQDAAGNGAISNVTVTVANTAPPAVIRIEETSTTITYAGEWAQGNTDRAWSGGTAAFSPVALARATLSFSGTGVQWIGFRGTGTGIANVYLDDVLVATVNTYGSPEVVQAVLFAATGLAPNVPHTLAIEVTGTKDEASSGVIVVVDAFDVTR
jgi:hypothetical protein